MKFVKTEPNSPATGFSITGDENAEKFNGFTKREQFAAMAMQGLLSTLTPENGNWSPNNENVKYCANLSVLAAEELIEQLNK